MQWDQILPLAIMMSLVIVLMLFMRRRLNRESRRPEIARVLCSQLGFNLITGNEARFFNQGPSAVPLDLAALNQLPSSLKASLLEDSSWRGEGVFDGVRVAVYDDIRPTGNRFQIFLVIRAYFPDPPAVPFRLERKGISSLFTSNGFLTGNAFFDKKIRLSGSKEAALIKLISRSKFLKAAEALFLSSRRARIDETGAYWEKIDAPLDITALKETLRLVTRVVLGFPLGI